MKLKNIIIITGASSGIGREFANKLDTALPNIDEFWLIARRDDRLRDLQATLKHKVKMIKMDVTDEYAMDDFENLLESSGVIIRMLINAAGFGIIGYFDNLSLQEQLDMLMVNCESLTKMTYICLPFMSRGSRIIQMASSAAFIPQPNFAVYAATKSYVLSLSRALNREQKYLGIYVTAVCPGPVDTEFFTIAEKYESSKFIKRLVRISPEKCVEDALRASSLKKDISIPGIPMKSLYTLTRLIPHSLLLKFLK